MLRCGSPAGGEQACGRTEEREQRCRDHRRREAIGKPRRGAVAAVGCEDGRQDRDADGAAKLADRAERAGRLAHRL